MNNLLQKYWFTPNFPKIHLKIQTTSIREYLSKYVVNQVSKKSAKTCHTNSIIDAKMFIDSLPARNLLILIKGSRAKGLDELVTRL